MMVSSFFIDYTNNNRNEQKRREVQKKK